MGEHGERREAERGEDQLDTQAERRLQSSRMCSARVAYWSALLCSLQTECAVPIGAFWEGEDVWMYCSAQHETGKV